MVPDLDRIDMPYRSMEYRLENPKKVNRMDPDQGGTRGDTFMPDSRRPGSEDEKDPGTEELPEEDTKAREVVREDEVTLSPEAKRAMLDAPITQDAGKKDNPDDSPPPPSIDVIA